MSEPEELDMPLPPTTRLQTAVAIGAVLVVGSIALSTLAVLAAVVRFLWVRA